MKRGDRTLGKRRANWGLGLVLLLTVTLLGSAASPRSIQLSNNEQDVILFGADGKRPAFFGDSFGYHLAVGDFDGDGISDLLVGAGTAESQRNNRGSGVGEVYLFFGRTDWPEVLDACMQANCANPGSKVQGSGSPDVIIFGKELGIGYPDMLGESVWSGDIDGDGLDDIIAPASLADGPRNGRRDAGEVYVIFGRPRGEWPSYIDTLQDEHDITIFGADPDDYLYGGNAGDVDGDGISDLILRSGAADGPQNSRVDSGEVYVFFGRSRGQWEEVYDIKGEAGPKPEVFIFGVDSEDSLGWEMATADVDGDGIPDMIIAASGGDGPDGERQDAGEVYILFGRARPDWGSGPIDLSLAPSSLTKVAVIYGACANDSSKFGLRVSAADVDEDSLGDFLLGFDQANMKGRLFFGRGPWPSTIDLLHTDADINFEWPPGGTYAMMLSGDIDGDEKVDFVGSEPGVVGVFFYFKHQAQYPPAPPMPGGGTQVNLASSFVPPDITIYEADPGDGLADAIVSGDINGDGYDDLIISARKADGPNNRREDVGEAYVIFGSQ
ncbi:MAG: hypothetical protein AMJ46_13975 [Latescibacteria bacterium DG_63]|nr:MAG: hypothetical protein AMJ46_13975 [Latescibacteria bacterium DG_63]